ncbi:MAG: SGNH/GDSL hydrolase family protein [Tannerella sp.]|nr:SGNH/GDSL hydrolase family protein [Tannerella sp.]
MIPEMAFAGTGDVPDKEKGFVFLFQGDSITDGNWGRNLDPNHFLGHGYAFSIASRIGADFPQAGFTFHNRGISGNKVNDLEQRWDQDAIALKPDVLSLLIGVNDAGAVVNNRSGACDTAAFEKKYRSILLQSQKANPDIIFVLGLPFIYPVKQQIEKWNQWERELPPRAETVKKLAKEFNAILIDYPAMFEKAFKSAPMQYWVWDGCHPSYAGHELMAREWIRQVSSKLKFLKKYKGG